MIHCYKCDADIPSGMTFCTNCGERLVIYGNDFVIPNVGDRGETETVVRKFRPAPATTLFQSATDSRPSAFTAIMKWLAGTVAATAIAVLALAAVLIAALIYTGSKDDKTASVPTPPPRNQNIYVAVTPEPTRTPEPQKPTPPKPKAAATPDYYEKYTSNMPLKDIEELDRINREADNRRRANAAANAMNKAANAMRRAPIWVSVCQDGKRYSSLTQAVAQRACEGNGGLRGTYIVPMN